MIRLSRQAWNNVLIVTMIVMIFLFNSTNNILTGGHDGEPQEAPILPPGSLILTLEIGAQKIERIGRNWRTSPAVEVQDENLTQVMSNWKSALMIAEDGPVGENPIVVVIWLAGESKGRVFQVYEEGGDVILFTENQRYRVVDLNVLQLIPQELNHA